MAHQVQMPQLGESVTEGTITRWLKQVGDRVEVDEPLVEVSTDKVDTEIPSPFEGVLEQILVAEDDTVPVGADLAVIGDGSGAAGGGGDAASQEPQQASEPEPEPAPAPEPEPEPEPEPAPAPAPEASTPQPEAAARPAQAPAAGPATDITMPALGESVTEGTVTRWLVQVGDSVEVDQPILEVSTDKVDTEIPSPAAGVISEIVVGEDQTVEVGTVLARVGGVAGGGAPGGGSTDEPTEQRDEQPAAPEPEPEPAPAPEQPQPARSDYGPPAGEEPRQEGLPAVPSSPATQAPAESGGDAPAAGYVTPIVRKLAGEIGVDLSSLQGTGVGGRIRRQDVVAAGEKAKQEAENAKQAQAGKSSAAEPKAPSAPAAVAPSPLRGSTEKMSRIRQTISRRMMESLHGSAQLTTVVEVDVTRVARLRQRAKAGFEAREGVKLSFLPFFARAAVEALKVHPIVNASIDGDSIRYHDGENLGIAVDTERGLMVPVIRDAGDLNLPGLAKRIADLAARTRDRKVGPDELSGGTFTLTNTGSRGALFDTPIINQPESAILGTGAVVKRPVVVEADGAEGIAVRSMVYLALSYDHRIVDGADAARFLTTVKSRLEEASFESELGL